MPVEQNEHASIKLIDSLFINTIDHEPLPVGNVEIIEIVPKIIINETKEDIIKNSEIKVVSTESSQVTIDGKPINEWLFKNDKKEPQVVEKTSTATDNRLQTNFIPVKTKPVDILDTIKRYKNVRLDDAKRTSR